MNWCQDLVVRRRMMRLATTAAALVIPADLLVQCTVLFPVSAVGEDFVPLRSAAHALTVGQSVYTDPTFVYPPTAAPLFLPLALGGVMSAYSAYLVAGLAVLVATALAVGRLAPAQPLLAGVVAVLPLVAGPAAQKAYDVGNLSMFLTPVAVAAVVAWYRGRWTLGCALIAASLLVKPLLVPLLLVPLVAKRGRELLVALVPATLVLALAVAFVPGGRSVQRFLGYVASGTNLHGTNAVNNLSLAGWAETHGLPPGAGTAVGAALAVVVGVLAFRWRNPSSPLFTVQLAAVAFVTTLLAGRISELHFLLPLVAIALVRLAIAPSARAMVQYGPFLLLSWLAPDDLRLPHVDINSWYVAVELLALVTVLADLRRCRALSASAVPTGRRTGSRPAWRAVRRAW